MKHPRLAFLLLVSAIAAWLAGGVYTWFADPEMKFWTAAARQKLDWVEKMREKHGYVVGVVGGSTTTFGIDAEYIEREHDLPVANLGLHVGMGPEACIGFGLSALRKGDTLVLSLEPGALTEEYPSESKSGRKLSILLRSPETVHWAGKSPVLEFLKSLTKMTPGGYQVMTMVGKLAIGMPLYRYDIAHLRPGGLQVTQERRDFAAAMDFSSPGDIVLLSRRGAQLLRDAQLAAHARGIKLYYVMPWSFWPRDTVERRRRANSTWLRDLSQHVQVLVEPEMGAHPEGKDFADSGQHLTLSGARARSEQLAESLRLAERPSSRKRSGIK